MLYIISNLSWRSKTVLKIFQDFASVWRYRSIYLMKPPESTGFPCFLGKPLSGFLLFLIRNFVQMQNLVVALILDSYASGSPSRGAGQITTAHSCISSVAEVPAWADVGQGLSAMECSIWCLELSQGWRTQRECGGAGGGQAVAPRFLPDGERALYPCDARVRAYRPPAPCVFCFEVKPLGILVGIKGRLKSRAMHEVFSRQRCCVKREQRLLPLQQGNEPSRGSCNLSNPYHGGTPWRKSPAWCPRPLHPLWAPAPSSTALPCISLPWHPPPGPPAATPALAGGLKKSPGEGVAAGHTETSSFSLSGHLKNVCKPSARTYCIDHWAVLVLPGISLKMWQELRKTSFSQLRENPFAVA